MRRALPLVLSLAALVCLGCPGERSPFCGRWFKLDESERDREIRDKVQDWRRDPPVRGPAYVDFLACVGDYVLDRRAAIDSACRNLGDLEAGVTIGRLIAAGAEACAQIPRVPVP